MPGLPALDPTSHIPRQPQLSPHCPALRHLARLLRPALALDVTCRVVTRCRAGELLPLRGLDIGCGANFIYCLLGAVLYGWSMSGVDVTATAVRCCRKLIADNPQVGPWACGRVVVCVGVGVCVRVGLGLALPVCV